MIRYNGIGTQANRMHSLFHMLVAALHTVGRNGKIIQLGAHKILQKHKPATETKRAKPNAEQQRQQQRTTRENEEKAAEGDVSR